MMINKPRINGIIINSKYIAMKLEWIIFFKNL